MRAGGYVAEATNTYKSNAKLSLNNAAVEGQNINLKSSSDIRTKNDGVVNYVGGVGGVFAENEMKLTNTLNQASEIEIKNSDLLAKESIVLAAQTSSSFRQKTSSDALGIAAAPRSKNRLNVTNNNKITVDADSGILAADEVKIDFNSDNTLETRANSEALTSVSRIPWRNPIGLSRSTTFCRTTVRSKRAIWSMSII